MAEREAVEPSPGTLYSMAHAAAHQFWAGQGFITPEGERYFSDASPHAPQNSQNAFAYDSDRWDDTTVRIRHGEAFIAGKGLFKDTVTDYELPDNIAGQTLYLGWAGGSSDTILIGLEADYPEDHAKIPIYEFNTANGEVTDWEDLRVIGPRIKTDDDGHVVIPPAFSGHSGWIRSEEDGDGRPNLGVGHPDNSEGIWLSATTDGTISYIAPEKPGEPAGGNQLRFEHDDELPQNGRWIFRRGFGTTGDFYVNGNTIHEVEAITGGPTLTGGMTVKGTTENIVDTVVGQWKTTNSNNWIEPEWSSDGQRFVLTPVIDGNKRTQQQLRYNFDTERWEFRSSVDVGGTLTSSDRGVVSEASEWDGNTMEIRTESGDTITFIAEE
ncbi:hypothetical protein [Halalkalicoccus sp. NIPERK01]|uniref:hypothetical protein n=1 Tax=Halalkalicoccus sp. NIPERK01 TaxID=3053469 RepID=UPI00256EE8DA|nr:hypothetical protein [Halalkalicoccus sp. NIPERK01]MDL5361341.1 hypothetical protein [Halalkalicoccus sp. NIPERK01]